ncbi:protein kinase, partial [Pirellulaceae bacterium]|nr:protein kinase [Pirellulaceae bacterium]
SLGDEVTQGSDTDVFSLGDESTTGESYQPDGGYVPEGEELVDLSKRYRLEDKPLGRGGFGEVFGAFDERLNRKVAIKRILGKAAASSKAVKRFLIEARAVAGLSHPNLIEVYDYGYSAEGPFLIMEYVSGGSLLDRSRAEGALSPDIAVDLFTQLCDGLAKAHSAGITHRDIKPANILVTEDDIPKLTDFGLAKDEGADMSMTATGAVMGTYDFMPSEQREGIHLTDHRSDLWSLAATFYQMLTGKSPKVINLHSVPESLQPVLAKALEESPADRYQSALEMKEAVLQVYSGRKDTTRELEKGECPSCGEFNPPDNKFCKGCSEPLQVKCLGCREEMPIWEAHCGKCGQQQSELLKFVTSTLQQQHDEAESLLHEMQFTEALDVAQQVAEQEDPRLQNFLVWYQDFKQRVDVQRDSAHSHVQQLLSQAQAHEEAEDYEAGLRALEQIHPTLLHLKLAGTDWHADSLKQHLQEQREQFALLEANLSSCMENGKAYLKALRFEEAIRAVAPLKNLTRRGLERYTLWHEKFISLIEQHQERELPGLRLTLGQALACEERGDIEGVQKVLGELQPALLNLKVEGLATGTEILKRIGGDVAWVEQQQAYFKKIRVRAERLLGTSAFDEALREAAKIDTQGHSQLEVYEQWRVKFAKAVEATRETAYTEVRSRIAKALSCEESYEYAEGLTHLEGVKRVLLEANVGLPATGMLLASRLHQAATRVSKLERELEASPKTLSVLPLLDELSQLCPNRLELKALELEIREAITAKELRNKEAGEKLQKQLRSAKFQ